MIKLYCSRKCPRCGDIVDLLDELAVAHEVIYVTDENRRQVLPKQTSEPVLVEGKNIVQGSKAITDYLEKLEDFKQLWYKFQSDACYCDEQGNVQ